MTDPTHDPDQDQQPLRLVLDEGERLEVRLTASSTKPESGPSSVMRYMPAWRAADLARVMNAYSRVAAIFSETSEVSGTESSLARALINAAAGGLPRQPHRARSATGTG